MLYNLLFGFHDDCIRIVRNLYSCYNIVFDKAIRQLNSLSSIQQTKIRPQGRYCFRESQFNFTCCRLHFISNPLINQSLSTFTCFIRHPNRTWPHHWIYESKWTEMHNSIDKNSNNHLTVAHTFDGKTWIAHRFRIKNHSQIGGLLYPIESRNNFDWFRWFRRFVIVHWFHWLIQLICWYDWCFKWIVIRWWWIV